MEAKAQQEFKIVTVVESIVPMGIGRSRIIDSQTENNYEEYTTDRTDGKKVIKKKSKGLILRWMSWKKRNYSIFSV